MQKTQDKVTIRRKHKKKAASSFLTAFINISLITVLFD